MSNTLYQRIQQFYDASSGLWEQIWGEHMHHGYYGLDGSQRKDRRQAQIDLIDELLVWGGVEAPRTILDVGCGIGGSTLYLAERYCAKATGITLSPVQAERASQRAQEAKLDYNTAPCAQFLVADAQAMPFADNSFDLVWSLESGEHMPNKAQFLQECWRVLKPSGLLLMATWCHRPVLSADRKVAQPLTNDELQHLARIYEVYCLPYVISLTEYAAIAQDIGFHQIRTADWSTAVAPFWQLVIDSALTPMALWGLLRSGWGTIRAALSLGLMSRGYERGLIRYGLLCATK
jgi:tocopherol O-methyltransferase